MTRFLLIRHASNDWLGKGLAGRTPGVTLNRHGLQEAAELAERLAGVKLTAIYASPRERAQDTARPLAERSGLAITTEPALDEIDFGGWTGHSFSDLAQDPGWATWVNHRSIARPPGGESLVEAQTRVIDAMARLRRSHAEGSVALVTHGDIIKAALAHHLALSLDHLERFDIAPASISIVATGDDWSQIKLVNHTGALPV